MRIIIFCIALLLITGCDTLKELQNSINAVSAPPKKTRPSVKDPKWRFGPEYVETMASISIVESWAYQKLANEAIEKNDIETLKRYIQKGVNPNMGVTKGDGTSLLANAINKGCYECIKVMAGKANLNFSKQGAFGLPIVQAALHSNEMLDFLMTNYDINPNCYGKAPFATYMATGFAVMNKMPKRYYTKNNREEVIRYMLNKGAKPMYGSAFPFYLYFEHIDIATAETVELFAQKGADFNSSYSGNGQITILGYTIEKKRYDIAKVLLENGTDPNYCHGHNSVRAPMYWAIEHNNLEMVKLLEEHGADINYKDYWNCKPSGSALDFAIKENKDKAIINYLIEKGAK